MTRVGDQQLPVGGDDLRRDKVVGGEAPGARREPETAAEHMAADPNARARSGRNREPVRAEPVVDVPEPRRGTDDRVPRDDAHGGEVREVHDHAGRR
jgi:hypothetical protein